MILLAGLIGAAVGAGLILVMWREGMLQQRAGLCVLLAAIAFFYPVFAAADGDAAGLVLHGLVFAAFAALALRGWRRGTYLIAGGLIAHGFFDVAVALIGAPGPFWWPAFCAGFDLLAGAAVLRLLQGRRIAA